MQTRPSFGRLLAKNCFTLDPVYLSPREHSVLRLLIWFIPTRSCKSVWKLIYTQVCVNYKDLDYLRDECADGRRLGFSGKVTVLPFCMDDTVAECD